MNGGAMDEERTNTNFKKLPSLAVRFALQAQMACLRKVHKTQRSYVPLTFDDIPVCINADVPSALTTHQSCHLRTGKYCELISDVNK